MLLRLYIVVLWGLAIFAGQSIYAQESGGEETPQIAVSTSKTVLDEAPFATVRAAGMAGALAPFADDLDAAVYNPAGIGGLRWGKQKVPSIRKVFFPHLTLGVNPDSNELMQELGRMARERPQVSFLQATEAEDSPEADQAMSQAAAGQRQYVRASVIPLGLVVGRTILVPFTDQQIAAVSRGSGTGLIDMQIRRLSGIGGGMSVTDTQERVSIGYFAYTGTRRETSGVFESDQFSERKERNAAIAANSKNYTGLGHNVGANFRLGHLWTPTLAVVLKNAGKTIWKADQGDDLTVDQDLTVGLGLSPTLAKLGFLNLALEGYRLMDENVSLQKKLRVGSEVNLWGYGSYAGMSLRTGYSDEGLAAGLTLNLGLFGAEVALHSVDIGRGNEKVIEQRYLGTVFINVAEF